MSPRVAPSALSGTPLAVALALAIVAAPPSASAQAHQMLCSSTDAAGVTITVLGGSPVRLLIGACGTYVVAHVERGPSGLFAVGDHTFAWGGAAATGTTGEANTLETMAPVVADVAGGPEPDLALGFAQFSAHGGGRGGGVFVVPMLADGSFGRALHPFRGNPASLTHFDSDADGREDLVVVENGEPWAARPGALSLYVRGRRARRIASVVMAPLTAAVVGTGPSARVLVGSQTFHAEDGSSESALATASLSGGTVTSEATPHDSWSDAFADFDRDGQLDVAMAGQDGVFVSSPGFEHVRPVDSAEPTHMDLVDLDGTGLHALAYCGDDHLRVATCDAARCYSVPWLGVSCESYAFVVIADLDGDGQREMLMANREHYQDDESRSAVWLTFIPQRSMHTGVPVVQLPFTAGPSTALR